MTATSGIDGTDANGAPISSRRYHRLARHPGDAGADVRSRAAAGTCWPSPSASLRPSPGQNGNFIWPNIQGNSYVNHDLSLFKNFPFGSGGKKFQFRASAYNVFNHPQRAPDDARNLNLNLRQRRADERELRPAANRQQVRPAHRPARVQVLLLRRPAGLGAGCACPRTPDRTESQRRESPCGTPPFFLAAAAGFRPQCMWGRLQPCSLQARWLRPGSACSLPPVACRLISAPLTLSQ